MSKEKTKLLLHQTNISFERDFLKVLFNLKFIKIYSENSENLNEALSQETRKLQDLQQKLQEASSKYQELSLQYEELQALSAEKHEENAGLSLEISRLTAEKEQLEEAFREKERVFLRSSEQFEKISAENAYLSRSLEEKDSSLKQNFKEIERLQRALAISAEKAEKLQSDLFLSQKNFAEFEAGSKENIKLMRQNLEMITLENQSLSSRVSQTQRDFLEKSEEDKRISADLKKELYISSLKLKEKDEKLADFEQILKKTEENLRETEQKLRNSAQTAQKLEASLHLTHYAVAVFMLILAVVARPMLLIWLKGAHFQEWFYGIWAVVCVTAIIPSAVYTYARFALGEGWGGVRVIPSMLILGVGICVNNSIAVIRGLYLKGGEFVRTPKSGSTAGKRAMGHYQVAQQQLWILEIVLGVYSLWTFKQYLDSNRYFFSIFLLLYGLGFLWMGVLSRPVRLLRRRDEPAADSNASPAIQATSN